MNAKNKQKQSSDAVLFNEMELEMERRAIANSMMDERVPPIRYKEVEEEKFQVIKQEPVFVPPVIPQQEIPRVADKLVINPEKYQQQIRDDNAYIAQKKEISDLLTRQWNNQIYRRTFNGVPAAALANCIFVHRRAQDDQAFSEVLSAHIQRSDEKIQSVQIRIDPF